MSPVWSHVQAGRLGDVAKCVNFEVKLPGANLFDVEALNTLLCLNFSIGLWDSLSGIVITCLIGFWVNEKVNNNKNAF